MVFLIPSSRGLASDFVLAGLASEGYILLNLIGLDRIAVLVLVDVGYGLLARCRSLTKGYGVIVWNLSVLGWILRSYRVAWLALLWSPAWNFWNLAVHDLGWVIWISFIRNWFGPWNWVAV